MYRDTVTLTVSAEQRGRESEAVDNPNVAIGLKASSRACSSCTSKAS